MIGRTVVKEDEEQRQKQQNDNINDQKKICELTLERRQSKIANEGATGSSPVTHVC